MISSHSEEPVANFKIVNLYKSAEEFSPDKKARPDLNFQAINLKFDGFKIKAWSIKNAKAYKKFMSFRGAVANFNIAQPTFSSAFNIVWIKPYHSTRVRLPVLCKL